MSSVQAKKSVAIGVGLAAIVVVAVTLLRIGAGDEGQIKNSIQKSVKAWNEKDYRTEYERMTPNYRKKVSYQEWENYAKVLSGLALLFLGPGKIEIRNINVRIKGEWAYASYKIEKGGEIIDSINEDIFRKVKGKWYDVVDNPRTPGYNREDLPPDRR